MDLKINSTAFTGNKEIIYGLTKAAKEVNSYSKCIQPHMQKLGENRNIPIHEAKAKAYLDMVVNDSEFEYFTVGSGVITLQKAVKDYLAPLNSGVKPFDYFMEFLHEVLNKQKQYAEKCLIDRLSELQF